MSLYLIAHKVRGEPAFDIAIQMPMDDGIWWIIPTSGHRAYPYWVCGLDGLFEDANIWPQSIQMPEGHPDHYAANDRQLSEPEAQKAEGQSLLAKLGLTRKPSPFTDRRL